MRRIVLLSPLLVLALVADCAAGQLKIEITAPPDKTSVLQRPIVEGRASDSTAIVWVVVHPLEASDYWVQPRVTLRSKGSWKVQVHIGRPGNRDVGKTYEIRAVANPEAELQEGKVLPAWPKASTISDAVEVTRK